MSEAEVNSIGWRGTNQGTQNRLGVGKWWQWHKFERILGKDDNIVGSRWHIYYKLWVLVERFSGGLASVEPVSWGQSEDDNELNNGFSVRCLQDAE